MTAKRRTPLTLADLHMLPRAKREALTTWLEVPSTTPLAQLRDRLDDEGWDADSLEFALTLLEVKAPELKEPVALAPTHPLCDLYDAADLKQLSRKLEIPHHGRSLDALARDIEALALKHDWTLETLNLLLHTRKMPKLIKREDIMG